MNKIYVMVDTNWLDTFTKVMIQTAIALYILSEVLDKI